MEEGSPPVKALCELQGSGDRTRACVNKRSQSSSDHLLPYFSPTYLISLWYSCYQSSVSLTPDREFPVQDAAFIVPDVVPTLATLSQALQFLEVFIGTSCWTVKFQKHVSFHLRKNKKETKIRKKKQGEVSKSRAQMQKYRIYYSKYVSYFL